MRFGGVVAVDQVDFAVQRGELRCLIGPNGAGKSTLFKCLTGQLRASMGRVVFCGHDITRAQPHEIARLGMGIKTQVPSVFDGLSVRENIWLAARRGVGKAKAREISAEIFDELALAPIAARIVGALAHGQRQLVELGVVLAGRPSLILLDEPTAGMSQDEVARTADLIRRLNETTTLIVVEHDMQFIKMIASHVTVLHQGRILIEDEIDVVMADQNVRDVYLGRSEAAA